MRAVVSHRQRAGVPRSVISIAIIHAALDQARMIARVPRRAVANPKLSAPIAVASGWNIFTITALHESMVRIFPT
jgi:hypothetical protein